jgi:hypothetical protein
MNASVDGGAFQRLGSKDAISKRVPYQFNTALTSALTLAK